MRTDMEIQKDVVAELRWESSLRDDDIAVGVRDGVVTLAGFVDSYGDKWTAERVASKVKGVKAIADDLEVKLPSSSTRPDPDLAHAAVTAWDTTRTSSACDGSIPKSTGTASAPGLASRIGQPAPSRRHLFDPSLAKRRMVRRRRPWHGSRGS